jgi:hypothetical protein
MRILVIAVTMMLLSLAANAQRNCTTNCYDAGGQRTCNTHCW